MHVHDLMPFHTTKFDMSHSVNKLSFGDDFPGVVNPLDAISRNMPGKGLSHAPRPACAVAHTRPAKGALRPEGRIPPGLLPRLFTHTNPSYTWSETLTLFFYQSGDAGTYQYFLKVVPTVFEHKSGGRVSGNKVTRTNQFSVTDHFKQVDAGEGTFLPGVFFFYDLSPIKVTMTETGKSFLSFLTSVFAIVGGAFAVSAIVDAAVFHGGKALKKKIDLGKQG